MTDLPASQPVRSLAFSRLLTVDEVPDDGVARMIEADADECAAVAAELGLPAIRALSANFEITRLSGGGVQVDGLVRASITQICVVSLDPFESDVSQAIDVAFAPSLPPEPAPGRRGPPASRRRGHAEPPQQPASPVRVAEGEADPPDPIVDGRIDLGGLAVEFLTLALDIYPRKPGVRFSDVVVGETGDQPSAFAALARLKDPS